MERDPFFLTCLIIGVVSLFYELICSSGPMNPPMEKRTYGIERTNIENYSN